MLRLMLNRHPELAVPFESGFIPEFYRAQERYGDLSDRYNAARLLRDIAEHPKVKKGGLIEDADAILARPISRYGDLVHAIFAEWAARRGKPRWGDKTPAYVTELDVLWNLFPGCRIVHLVRDGRDVAVSLRQITWGSDHIPAVAVDWRWKTTLAHKIGAVLGEHYLEVRYEDLVLRPEDTLRAVCAFLGEPYHKDMLEFHATAELEMPKDSMRWHASSVKAPDPGKVELWRREMSAADRILFEDAAPDALGLFGYATERRRSTPGSWLNQLYYCMVGRG